MEVQRGGKPTTELSRAGLPNMPDAATLTGACDVGPSRVSL